MTPAVKVVWHKNLRRARKGLVMTVKYDIDMYYSSENIPGTKTYFHAHTKLIHSEIISEFRTIHNSRINYTIARVM